MRSVVCCVVVLLCCVVLMGGGEINSSSRSTHEPLAMRNGISQYWDVFGVVAVGGLIGSREGNDDCIKT